MLIAIALIAQVTLAPPAGSGGAGTPGGSTTQIQRNNAGAFGGVSGVTSDGVNLIPLKVALDPSAPSSTYVTQYLKGLAATTTPGLPKLFDSALGFGTSALYPFVGGGAPIWGCIQPTGFTTGSSTTGAPGSTSGSSAGSAATWATTSLLTRSPRLTYTTAVANTDLGLKGANFNLWVGNAAGAGGFAVWGSTAIETTSSTQRVFWGVANVLPGVSADPNTCTDCIYFGANAADTNLSICSNDATSTATCTTLGAFYPAKTANAHYNWTIWVTPNEGTVGYAIERLDSAASTSGTIATDLPRNTVQMLWATRMNTGANSTTATLDFGGICLVANP